MRNTVTRAIAAVNNRAMTAPVRSLAVNNGPAKVKDVSETTNTAFPLDLECVRSTYIRVNLNFCVENGGEDREKRT